MDGEPEGSGPEARPRPFWSIVFLAVFGAYIGFRAIQGLVWLVGTF
jgi:hypothetical protein